MGLPILTGYFIIQSLLLSLAKHFQTRNLWSPFFSLESSNFIFIYNIYLAQSFRETIKTLLVIGTSGILFRYISKSKIYIFRTQIHIKVKTLVAYLCPTLCDPMGCSLPGSIVHGIIHARLLAWVATSSPVDFSNSGNEFSLLSCRQILYDLNK